MSMSAFEVQHIKKENLTLLKGKKISFLGLLKLLTGLWNLKNIQNSLQNRSENKLVRENWMFS